MSKSSEAATQNNCKIILQRPADTVFNVDNATSNS